MDLLELIELVELVELVPQLLGSHVYSCPNFPNGADSGKNPGSRSVMEAEQTEVRAFDNVVFRTGGCSVPDQLGQRRPFPSPVTVGQTKNRVLVGGQQRLFLFLSFPELLNTFGSSLVQVVEKQEEETNSGWTCSGR